MSLSMQPVRVATGLEDEGRLVFHDDRLVAVLVRLDDHNEVAPAQWFYEAGFGALDGPEHPTFATLEQAQEYIMKRLGRAKLRP